MFSHHFGNTQPPPWVHMTNFDNIGLHEVPHGLSFKAQVVACLLWCVFLHDQIDDFFRIRHGITPTVHTCLAKGGYSLWMLVQFILGGK